MKKVIVLLAFIASLTQVFGQGSYRFSAVLSDGGSGPIGKGLFWLTGDILDYAIGVDLYSSDLVGGIYERAGSGSNARLLFVVPGFGCVAPLAPFAGSCGWFGRMTLSPDQVGQLLGSLWEFRASDISGAILLDDDLDGVPDTEDRCAGTPLCFEGCREWYAQRYTDSQGCMVEQLPQLCPREEPKREQADYIHCLREATEAWVKDQLMTSGEQYVVLHNSVSSESGMPVMCHGDAQMSSLFSATPKPIVRSPSHLEYPRAAAIFGLQGNTLDYIIGVQFYRSWTASIDHCGDGTNVALIDLGKPQACGRLRIASTFDACQWFGEVILSDAQRRDLMTGRLHLELSFPSGGFPLALRAPIIADSDFDGVPDVEDRCPETPFRDPSFVIRLDGPPHVGARGCSVEQLPHLCPCEGPWQWPGEYISCLSKAITGFLNGGLLPREEAESLRRAAVKSDCGEK